VGTWFRGHSTEAIADFFEACDSSFDAHEASARELNRIRAGAIDSVAERLTEARARHVAARGGDWAPFETHLRALGERFAREGLPFEDWYRVVDRFYETLAPRIARAWSGEPERVGAALLVLGEYMRQSLSLIERAYHDTRAAVVREARERSAQVLDAAIDAVITIDAHGAITEFNESAEKMFGHARDQVLGRTLAEVIIPERLRAAHAAGLARAASGAFHMAGRRTELVAIRASGEEFPVELSIVATRVDGERYFTGFVRDLTERKQAEASVAVWQHALDHAQFGIAISSVNDGVLHSVNSTYAAMLGYRPDELVGRSGQQLVAEESRASTARLAKLVNEHGAHTYEMALRRKDGASLLVLVSTSTVEIESRPVRVSTVIDIDQRRKLEEAILEGRAELERTAQRLRIISTTSHEFASASGDPEAVLALVARRLAEIIGDGCGARCLNEDGEWIETSSSFFHPNPEIQAAVRTVLSGKRQRVGEGLAGRAVASHGPVLVPRLAGPFGELAPEEFRATLDALPIKSALSVPLIARGRTIGVVSLFRIESEAPYDADDVQLASALADRAGLALDNAMLVATLERRVSERTAELEAANRELESFSYSVSHDLRAPLRAIGNFAGALATDYEQVLDETGRHYTSRILAGAKRMNELTEALLDLARISRMPLRRTIVDLSAIATEVVEELRRRDPDRVVDIGVQRELTARGDARLVRIVLENLLGNAWKFTARAEQPKIRFGFAQTAFFVSDTGVGFDMQHADRLFAPFQRLHSGSDFEGLGLGLATVQRIIRHHGGTVTASSIVGEGTTFRFTIPA